MEQLGTSWVVLSSVKLSSALTYLDLCLHGRSRSSLVVMLMEIRYVFSSQHCVVVLCITYSSCFHNPWHTSTARVIVVRLSVCVICPLVNVSPLEYLFAMNTPSHTQLATNGHKYVCGELK